MQTFLGPFLASKHKNADISPNYVCKDYNVNGGVNLPLW